MALTDAQRDALERLCEAFVPGSGELPPRNAADIAWSEYNHHWAGLIVLTAGLLALISRYRWARWMPIGMPLVQDAV